MKLRFILPVAVLFAVIANPAPAETRLGVGYSILQYDYSDTGDGGGIRLFAEQGFGASPWSFALNYLDLRGADVENFDGASLEYLGAVANILYTEPFSAGSMGRWIIGGGLYSGNTQVAGLFPDPIDTVGLRTAGPALTFGLEWMASPRVGFRVDATNLFGVADAAKDKDVFLIGFALVFNTSPVMASPAPAPAVAPEPAPTAAPMVPVPFTAPAPTLAPVARPEPAVETATPFTKGGVAVARAGASLRLRATAGAEALLNLEPGSVLELLGDLKNSDGNWWYAAATGKRGWILESELLAKP